MINKAAFIQLLKTKTDADQICRDHLFSSSVWLFDQQAPGKSASVNDRVKAFFAHRLSLSNANVSIVGSAKLGFSLNPSKKFRDFDKEKSDIDVVIVASELFHEFWRELFRLFYTRGVRVEEEHFRTVFLRYVNLDDSVRLPSTIIEDWQRKVGAVKRDFYAIFQISNPIKYRIYESWSAVDAYHRDGIEKLRGVIP